MSRTEGRKTDQDCFDAAAAWHARWRAASGSGLPAEEVDEWAEWSKVPENKAAYDAVEFVSRARFMLKAPPLPTAEELAADDSMGMDDSLQAGGLEESVPAQRPQAELPPPLLFRRPAAEKRIPWRPIVFITTAAAAAAAAAVFTPVLQWFDFHPASERVQLVSTTSSELKQIVLTDGSRVTLGARTRLTVQYGNCHRTILLDAGEALFNVAHDPRCPFTVIAGDGAITALGTEFSVRRTLDRVTVQVAEGLVSVQPREALAPVAMPIDTTLPNVSWPNAKLAQGQEVTYLGNESRSPVESEDSRVATEWLDGRREYHHEPLEYLIADINRYVDEPVEMDPTDPEVGKLEFSGLVYESQVKKFLQDLEIIFPSIKVTRTEQNHILIQSRAAAGRGKSDDQP
jgi:transmembrane sensor